MVDWRSDMVMVEPALAEGMAEVVSGRMSGGQSISRRYIALQLLL
jgi:hypothetical protein